MEGVNPGMNSSISKERKEQPWQLDGLSDGSVSVGLASLFLLFLLLFQMIHPPSCLSRMPDEQGNKGNKRGVYLSFTSYYHIKMAVSEVARLKEHGYNAFYEETGQGKEKKFRVLAGPYPTRDKAAAAGEKLKKTGVIHCVRIIPVASSSPVGDRIKGKSNARKSSPIKKRDLKGIQGKKVGRGKEPASRISSVSSVEKSPRDRIQSREKEKAQVPPSAESKTALPPGKNAGKDQAATATPNSPETPGRFPDVIPPGLAVPLPTAVTPPVMPAAPVMPRWPYFDAAMEDFQRGRYAKARPVFQDILARSDIDASWRELAERRLADCMYFLKESNNNGVLYGLVYQYKNILVKYPDIRHGNDLAYWRLGHLYKALALYREAVAAYKSLREKYPASPLAEEGLYQMGDLLRLDGKYHEAVEILRAFYAKYPGSALSRAAIFSLADAYYRMGLSKDADIWYSSALQRWPDLYGLPDDIFLNTGYHLYSTGNYSRAFLVFSYFRGLYPQSRHISQVVRAMVRCLVGMDQTSSAIRLLNTVLAAEKDQKETIRLRFLLAELGAQKPGARTSVCFQGVEDYREPLLSCDRMLMELKGDALSEEVLYLKGNILAAMNHFREAFYAYAKILRLYPKSRYRASCRKSLEETRNALINDYYGKGDHLAVADLYFTGKGLEYNRDVNVLFKVADSLKNLGLYEQAAKIFQDLGNTQAWPDSTGLDLAIAEAEIKSGRTREGQARLVVLLSQKGAGGAVAKQARRILADSYYEEKNYDGAVESYAAAMPIEREQGAALSLYRYADALKRRGRGALALQYYQEALDRAAPIPGALSESLKGEIYLSRGECYFEARQYDQGIPLVTQSLSSLPEGSGRRWALFRLAGGYIRSNNPVLAEKSSSRVRENTEDPFWAAVADYGLRDGTWFAAYEDYLK